MPRINTNERPSAACSRKARSTSETDRVLPKKDRRVLELERRESAERRARFPHRARFRGGLDAAWQLTLDQAAEVIFQQQLEVARRSERMKRGDQGSFGPVVEPLVDEFVELLLLPEALHQVLLVVEPDRGRRSAAIHEQIGLAVPAEAVDRILEFVFSAGLIARPVRAPELTWERRAQTRPQYRDDDVGVRWLDDLLLKRRRGDERLVLPQNGLEHDLADVLALQALDDPARQRAFFEDVAWRRNEESQRPHGARLIQQRIMANGSSATVRIAALLVER